MADDGFQPGGIVRGDARPPASKSLAARVLLAGALAEGRTRLAGLGPTSELSEDVNAALAVLTACGAVSRAAGRDGLDVTGLGPAPHESLASEAPVELGESATLARLVTAALALCGRPGSAFELRVAGSLQRRGSAPLFASLRAAGAAVEALVEPGRWPLRVVACAPPDELELHRPVSSQEVSALLLAAAAHGGARRVRVVGAIPSEPYVDLTRGVLARFGAQVGRRADTFAVRGPLQAPTGPVAIEPDASAAAVALAAGCLTDGEVRVAGLTPGSLQGDTRIVEHLAAFGCTTDLDGTGVSAGGRPLRGAAVDLAGEPDLAPVLAAVAAAVALSDGEPPRTSRLTGLAVLPRKESDRLTGLAEALRALGLVVEASSDTLAVGPGAPTAGELCLDPAGDHRMAFAFALLGLVRPGVRVRDAECVAKSWPGFWDELERLGARRSVG